jgi:Recombinase-like helix-turn-helix domain
MHRPGAQQSRDHDPSPYDRRLAAAIENTFATGGHDLPDLIGGLNDSGVFDPDGQPWSEVSFAAAMKERGR